MPFITSKTVWQPVYGGDWNNSSCPLGTHLCSVMWLLYRQELKCICPFTPGCGHQDTATATEAAVGTPGSPSLLPWGCCARKRKPGFLENKRPRGVQNCPPAEPPCTDRPAKHQARERGHSRGFRLRQPICSWTNSWSPHKITSKTRIAVVLSWWSAKPQPAGQTQNTTRLWK